MKKIFNDSYHAGHSGMPPPGLVPELLACRACLATDTKLYTLDGALKDAYEYLMAMPLTTNMVRNVDRVSHKLLLKFTLGIDTKIIHVVHEDNDNKCNQPEGKTVDSDDIDGLTDVLNDFDEITKTLNDDVHLDLSEDEFDADDGPFIDRTKDFDVEELFKGKVIDDINETRNTNISNVEELFKGKVIDDINEISNKNISNDNDIGDIIQRAFMGKDKPVTKSNHNENLVAVKNEDTSSTFRDAEEVLKANLGDNLPPDDVSINTNDLNDTDSNLVDAFNNFILDHDYLDEKFLLESGDPEFMKKHVISKKTDEDSLLKEIIPSMSKKDKKLLKERDSEKTVKTKPVKNLSKLKEINRRAKLKIKTEVKESKNQLIISKPIKTEDSEPKPEPDDDKPNSKPIITKPELPPDGTVKSELSKEFIKFGADFNFRIFELSAEQQLEELQKKREGVLYLGAPYKCVDCAKGFHSAQTFGNHKRVHDPSYGQFPCAVCRARHKSDARRRRHADTHRLKYCCTQCEFVARSRERAEQHYQWHAGKKFSCQHCGEQFGKASTQLSHIRLQHPGACAWCALCGEPFVGALGLRQHTRRKHPQVIKDEERAEWHCGTCRVQFRNAELFRRHSVSGCTPSSLRSRCDSFESAPGARVQCLACSAWFSSVHSRQTHFERVHLRVPPRLVPAQPRAHATRATRPAMCELCGNKYHSAAALSYHRRTHTGERPFACPRCPKSFTHNHTLQAHMRTHTGERPYRCSQCTRAFPTANNLARHNRIVHLGQRQYSRCAVCRRWLSSPAAARAHARRVHGDRL